MADLEGLNWVSVHGFNDRSAGANSTDLLCDHVHGSGGTCDTDSADYGYWSLWKIVIYRGAARGKVLDRLTAAFEAADVIYAFSNGVNFTYQALERLGPQHDNTKLVICISGAMDATMPIPKAVKAQLVLYTPWDILVRLSSYLLHNRWGRQGAIGYKGPEDARNTNKKCASIRWHTNWFKKRFSYDPTWVSMYRFVKEKL